MAPLPPLACSWAPKRILDVGGATVRLDICEPADLRLSLDFGFAAIVATGIEDVGDLIEGFQLADETRVTCHRYAFVLDERGDDLERWVVYRDKQIEVRIPRHDYDRIAGVVADLVADPSVQAAFEQASAQHAVAAREAAWHAGSAEPDA